MLAHMAADVPSASPGASRDTVELLCHPRRLLLSKRHALFECNASWFVCHCRDAIQHSLAQLTAGSPEIPQSRGRRQQHRLDLQIHVVLAIRWALAKENVQGKQRSQGWPAQCKGSTVHPALPHHNLQRPGCSEQHLAQAGHTHLPSLAATVAFNLVSKLVCSLGNYCWLHNLNLK